MSEMSPRESFFLAVIVGILVDLAAVAVVVGIVGVCTQ